MTRQQRLFWKIVVLWVAGALTLALFAIGLEWEITGIRPWEVFALMFTLKVLGAALCIGAALGIASGAVFAYVLDQRPPD